MEQKVLRTGATVLVLAVFLRLLSGINLPTLTLSPQAASWMIFLQTGRLVRPSANASGPTEPEEETETTAETQPDTTEYDIFIPTFSGEDAAGIKISCSFPFSADLSKLVAKPLSWDLTSDEPTVLILHSHATESFTPTGEYTESSPYRTLDTDHNMVSVGAYVAELLTAGGISVIQDTALHDSPSYNDAYGNSRASVQKYLEQYPSIRLVLDLHRDSYEDANGNQAAHTVFSEGSALASLMLVVGTDYGGLTHPHWQENLALALKLQTQLESLCPGICRNINLRSQRFNQDLSPGALLVEVGASGNSRQEALGAAQMLANAILSLAHGSQ